MQATQWARARPDVDTLLRRGAWYRVVRFTPLEAILDVNGRPVAVAKGALQVLSAPPTRWTVVPRPHNASARLPTTWGPRYGVCPKCRERSRLEQRVAAMRCPKCNGFFDIGWDDSFFAV
jgi:hypothetical protein